MDSVAARQTFELHNEVRATSNDDDIRYFCNEEEQRELRVRKPWQTDPHWFKDVHISAVALIKMAMHDFARMKIVVNLVELADKKVER